MASQAARLAKKQNEGKARQGFSLEQPAACLSTCEDDDDDDEQMTVHSCPASLTPTTVAEQLA